ncbi:MAG: hypothetical protein JAY75_16340 [Candidatus Thiodiazotropha taylori]|nr:hypothetical protein [Candidatus Thiodiazotropha taylori]MCG8093293.1 hypothetical protein [Candidatus Thiodiazotropha endolucinida]MCW4309785.1 hypothetical protein [Candidatus Thiodiazotropha endolucinida]
MNLNLVENGFDFRWLADRVYEKYEISNKDAQGAVLMLLVFIRQSKINPNMFLVLPKLGDLAWHECICRTKYYHNFCEVYFGGYLHHVATSKKASSCYYDGYNYMREVIRRDLPQWVSQMDLDAGWNNRAYPLREKMQTIDFIDTAGQDDYFDSSKLPHPTDFEWLTHRVAMRYSISIAASSVIVDKYTTMFFQGDATAFSLPLEKHIDAVWQEHILWTEKYHRDCNRLYGKYLHRKHIPNKTAMQEVA